MKKLWFVLVLIVMTATWFAVEKRRSHEALRTIDAEIERSKRLNDRR